MVGRKVFILIVLITASCHALVIISRPSRIALISESQMVPVLAYSLAERDTGTLSQLVKLWPTNRMRFAWFRHAGIPSNLPSFPKAAHWRRLTPAQQDEHLRSYPRGSGEMFNNFETCVYAAQFITSAEWGLWPLLMNRSIQRLSKESRCHFLVGVIQDAVTRNNRLDSILLVAGITWLLEHFQDPLIPEIMPYSQIDKLLANIDEESIVYAWWKLESSPRKSWASFMHILLLGVVVINDQLSSEKLFTSILARGVEGVPIVMIFEFWELLIKRDKAELIPPLQKHLKQWLAEADSTERINYCLFHRERMAEGMALFQTDRGDVIPVHPEWLPLCHQGNFRAARWWLLETKSRAFSFSTPAGELLSALMQRHPRCFKTEGTLFHMTMECNQTAIMLTQRLLYQAACLSQPLALLPSPSTWFLLLGPLTTAHWSAITEGITRMDNFPPKEWITEIAEFPLECELPIPLPTERSSRDYWLYCLWLCQREGEGQLSGHSFEYELYELLRL